mmetsp:Transcript_15339/g.29154  ORF Transcript_15339/g.29154 Transcript_15339/m.29154 type:complete len:94 (+) Transcript_15339:426-707(+)
MAKPRATETKGSAGDSRNQKRDYKYWFFYVFSFDWLLGGYVFRYWMVVVVGVGAAALGACTCGLCFSGDYLTSGDKGRDSQWWDRCCSCYSRR